MEGLREFDIQQEPAGLNHAIQLSRPLTQVFLKLKLLFQ